MVSSEPCPAPGHKLIVAVKHNHGVMAQADAQAKNASGSEHAAQCMQLLVECSLVRQPLNSSSQVQQQVATSHSPAAARCSSSRWPPTAHPRHHLGGRHPEEGAAALVGDGRRQGRLAAARRPVQQHAAWWLHPQPGVHLQRGAPAHVTHMPHTCHTHARGRMVLAEGGSELAQQRGSALRTLSTCCVPDMLWRP